MSKIKPRAKIPKEAELDEVIEIKTLIDTQCIVGE